MSKYIANIITVLRIICSVLLIFTAPFSVCFYILYLICGISDMTDGGIARYFHTESKIGSRLDSLADFVFFTVVFFKIVPKIKITLKFMIWTGLIFVIRIICIGISCNKDKTDYVSHSFLNKLTGFLLFVSAGFIRIINLNTVLTVLCISGSIATVYELMSCLK
ncbi:MAG: CDP-alcohol phosphatidyltransferase family protein [Erysipelotrichaceae bacterium]